MASIVHVIFYVKKKKKKICTLFIVRQKKHDCFETQTPLGKSKVSVNL